MTALHFRILLVVYVACFVLSVGIGLSELGLSQALSNAYANEPEPTWFTNPWVFAGLGILLLGGTLAGLVGLFLFRSWGRSLSLWTTIASLLLLPFLGASLTSPLEDLFGEAASLLWGFILALAYYSSLQAKFMPPAPLPASDAGLA